MHSFISGLHTSTRGYLKEKRREREGMKQLSSGQPWTEAMGSLEKCSFQYQQVVRMRKMTITILVRLFPLLTLCFAFGPSQAPCWLLSCCQHAQDHTSSVRGGACQLVTLFACLWLGNAYGIFKGLLFTLLFANSCFSPHVN